MPKLLRSPGLGLILWLLSGWLWAAPAPQTIQWTSPAEGTLLRLGQSYPLAATASSGLPVTFRVAAGPASITDGQVTVTNSGRVTLVAEQAGAAHVAPATAFTTFNRGKLLFETVGGLSLGADWTSDSFSLVVSNGVAYAGSFSGLRTVDVRDPANPKLLDFIATSGTVFDLQTLGAYAFLATSAGLEVIDISNPAELSNTAQLPIGGSPYSLRLAGNRAYVAAGTVWIVDISQPNQPRKVGEIAEPFPSARDVAVVGDVLFVGGDGGVRSYDVSQPTSPVLLAAFGNPASAEIELVDGNLWVAARWGPFQVWDVGNPRAPSLIGSSQFPFGTIPIGFGMRLFAFDGTAFITQQQSGLLLMDAANPAKPINLGWFTAPYPNAMQVADGLHFEGGYGGSFRVFRRRETLDQDLQFPLPLIANLGSPIRLTAAAVKSVRTATAGREDSWTEAELLKVE